MEKIKPNELIRSLSAQKGVSIQELANKVGTTRASVSSTLKYNKLNVTTLKAYMNALGEDINISLSNGACYILEV